MKEVVQTIEKRVFVSEVHPEIYTELPRLSEAIAWADANPVAWEIVTKTRGKRSHRFGPSSYFYIGWAQKSMAPEAILERLNAFYQAYLGNRNYGIFQWSAKFTFEHFRDKGFTGGFFQVFDGKYYRECMTLDYTPDTLPEVVEQFRKWASLDWDNRNEIHLNKRRIA